jgi:hypothetical protein
VFPFSIFRLSFAIARNRTGQAMTNDKCDMENGKWKMEDDCA